MKRLSRKHWNQVRCLLGVLLLLGLGALLLASTAAIAQRRPAAKRPPAAKRAKGVGGAIADKPAFFARSYGGKCLDFGPPPHVSSSPVFIFNCNGTVAQQIRIEEINNRHDVILRAGNKVIGVKTEQIVGPVEGSGSSSGEETPIELQNEKDRNTVLSRGQIFALDGDSIILAANRDFVIKVQNNRGTDRTPLVLGRRELADNEFWTLTSIDNSNRKPTTGFVRVPQEKDFITAISDVSPEIHPGVVSGGTVIEVSQSSTDLAGAHVRIPEGVTIRGDRRGANLAGEIVTTKVPSTSTMLEIAGSDVRITGLRIYGHSRSTDEDEPSVRGIVVRDDLYTRVIIDHNDISDWTKAGVSVEGAGGEVSCADLADPRSIPQNVRVARNFIHHNRKQGKGYGVVVDNGSYPMIYGNTFYQNRHAIAADANTQSKYRAWYNLVQSSAPLQRKYIVGTWYTHDFDSHGSGSGGKGGHAGQFFEILRNTFLGTNRNNYKLRGDPCFGVAFHHNISLRDPDDAVRCDKCGDGVNKLSYPIALNRFNANNGFLYHFGVGDFDGDGIDDVFMATGEAWYYAPQGVAEWRFLNAQTEKMHILPPGGLADERIDTLFFGDFDADGRTDVFTQRGRDWLVSWGGASNWEKINESAPALSEFYVADFLGDARADVFYADGRQWWVSDGGRGPFVATATSGHKKGKMGFGDFNGDGKMDVVAEVSYMWKVSLNASGAWDDFPLRSALTNTMKGTFIADFNGNGIADIVHKNGAYISYDGRSDWKQFNGWVPDAVGRFDPKPGADVLYIHDKYFKIISSGVRASQRHSRQLMH